MALCKYCGEPFQWGRVEDRWIPLVPTDRHDGLDRAFQDEDGVLRADHRLVCPNHGGGAVRAVRLARPVLASSLVGAWSEPDGDGVVNPVVPGSTTDPVQVQEDQT